MHVLIIPSWYPTAQNPVAGIFFKEQAEALARHPDLEVGLMYGEFDWRKPFGLKVEEEYDGVVPTIRGSGWASPKAGSLGMKLWLKPYHRLFKRYQQKFGQPDLIHAHSWIAGLAASSLSEKLKIPYILTEHLSAIAEGQLNRRQTKLVTKAYRKAAALTAVSTELAEQVKELAEGRRVDVIPNSVDGSFFTPSTTPPRSKLILSIGYPWKLKGYDLLVKSIAEVAKEYKDVELWLGNEIDDPIPLYKLIDRLELRLKIRFIGLLSRQEVRDVMRLAHVYVSASRVETFGLTMIEALSCGKPVVATPTAGAKDIMEGHPETGLIAEAISSEELSGAILTVLRNYKRYNSKDIRQNTLERFDQQIVVQKTLNLYKEILHDR